MARAVTAGAIGIVATAGAARPVSGQIVSVVRPPPRVAAHRTSADSAVVLVVHPTTQLTDLTIWVDSAVTANRLAFDRDHEAPSVAPAGSVRPAAPAGRRAALAPSGRSAAWSGPRDPRGPDPAGGSRVLAERDVELRRVEIVQ
jgi:hypothetical protein